jgi:putrescine transport system substrate-binding protein
MRIIHLSALVITVLLIAVMPAIAGVSGQPGKRLTPGAVRVFNWADYIDASVLDDFSKSTGVAVTYNEYDDNTVLQGRMALNKSGYDVVVPSATPLMARLIADKKLRPLDKSQIPNLAGVAPDLMALAAQADPGNTHGVIYHWGTTGILYNVDMVRARLPDMPTDSWRMVFDETIAAQLKDCGIAVIDSAVDVYPLVKNYLGLDPNSTNPKDLLAAQKLLLKMRPHIKYFHSSRYLEDLATGRICVAIGYSGDYIQARDRAAASGKSQNIAYSIPHEGSNVWFDMLTIPADADNPDAAHAFINYLLQPAVMAKISSHTGYANAVPASQPLMDAAVRYDTAVYPPAGIMSRLFILKLPPAEFERTMQGSWARMRASVQAE